MNKYGHFYGLTMGGFGLIIGFNETLWLFSTNNYNSLAALHNLQITIAHVNLLSLLCYHQSLPDGGSQRRRSISSSVPWLRSSLASIYFTLQYINCQVNIAQDWLAQSQSHIVTDSRSVFLGADLRTGFLPDVCYCLTFTVLSLWGRHLWREDTWCLSVTASSSDLLVSR
jgi:hypothetical protein